MKSAKLGATFLVILSACSSGSVSKHESDDAGADQVSITLQSHKSEFGSCYDKGVKERSHQDGGKVETQFTIEADGKVRKASIRSSTLNVPSTESCLLRVIKGIQFPVPSGGGAMEVTYPFKFNSR